MNQLVLVNLVELIVSTALTPLNALGAMVTQLKFLEQMHVLTHALMECTCRHLQHIVFVNTAIVLVQNVLDLMKMTVKYVKKDFRSIQTLLSIIYNSSSMLSQIQTLIITIQSKFFRILM
jgi:hypothetical protein